MISLPGGKATSLCFTQDMVEATGSPSDWHARTGLKLADVKAWLVFLNPFSLNVEIWLKQWNQAYPHIPVFGGMAGGIPGDPEAWIFCDDRVVPGGVAIALQGDVEVHSVVSQGCKPIGEPLTVTQAERNVLLTLGSRPAYEVLSDVYKELSDTEREQAQGPSLRRDRGQRISRGIQAGRFPRAQHHRRRPEERGGRDQRRAARGPDLAVPVARFPRGNRRTEAPACASRLRGWIRRPTRACSAPAMDAGAGCSAGRITMRA